MMHRILTLAAVVATLTLGSPAVAAEHHNNANESDTRHCVTGREVWSINVAMPRRELEQRWDTRNRGEYLDVIVVGPAWTYRMCDRPGDLAFAVVDRHDVVVTVGIVEP